MITRLDIALEALREIATEEERGSVADYALAKIAAAPPEIVLTREEAELCAQALDLVTVYDNEPDIHDGCPNAALSRRLKSVLSQKETK